MNYLKTIYLYFSTGIFFTFFLIVLYSKNIGYLQLIIESAILFTIVSVCLEKIMFIVYTKFQLPSIARQCILIILGSLAYPSICWIIRPLITKYYIFKISTFIYAILPMFIIFSIIFERIFITQQKFYNDQLDEFKRNRPK